MENNYFFKERLSALLEDHPFDNFTDRINHDGNPAAPNDRVFTLIIGVGGSGISVIKETIRKANNKLSPLYTRYTKFLAIDKSLDELEFVRRLGVDTISIPASSLPPSFTVETWNEMTDTEFFREFAPRFLSPYYQSEYTPFISSRLAAKLCFYINPGGKSSNEVLRQKLMHILDYDMLDFNINSLNIIIVAGLGGLTGSGTFLDIAAQVKKAFAGMGNIRLTGYFMLPDTFEDLVRNEDNRSIIYSNGFAALKELESYMSIDLEETRKELFPAPNPHDNFEISGKKYLFDYPVLVSGRYDSAVATIANTIVTDMTRIEGLSTPVLFRHSLPDSRLSEIDTIERTNTPLDILTRGACQEDSRLYCGIGYGRASIPKEVVIPNVFSRVIRRIYRPINPLDSDPVMKMPFCTHERRLSRIEFENAMRLLLGIDSRAILEETTLLRVVQRTIINIAKVGQNTAPVPRCEDLISGHYHDYLRGFNVERTVNNALQQIPGELQRLYRQLEENARSVMQIYGPRVIEFLYDGVGNNDENGVPENFRDISLRRQIEVVSMWLNQVANTPARYPDAIGQLPFFQRVIRRQSIVEDWCNNAARAAQQDVLFNVTQRLTGRTGGWRTEYDDRVAQFTESCIHFADILETMADCYTGVGSSLDETNFSRFADFTSDSGNINLCSDQKIFNWVRSCIETRVSEVNIADAKQSLIDDFYVNKDDWRSPDEGVAKKRFDDVMCQICLFNSYDYGMNGLNLTVADYYNEILRDVPLPEQTETLERTVQMLMDRLITASAPSLDFMEVRRRNSQYTIIIPQNLVGQFGQAVMNMLHRYFDPSCIAFSSDTDEIVCLQTSFANALCSFRDLSLWENSYRKMSHSSVVHLSNGDYARLHLETGYTQYKELTKRETDRVRQVSTKYDISEEDDVLFGTGLSWLNHPSINERSYIDGFYSDATAEKNYRNTVFNKKIDKAIELGIIEIVEHNNCCSFWLNMIPNDWTDFSCEEYDEKKPGGCYKRGQVLFDYLAARNPHSIKPHRRQIRLYNCPFFRRGELDFSNELLLRDLSKEQIPPVCISYLKRIMRKATGLYQDMEDTMYLFYDIEKELEEKECSLT